MPEAETALPLDGRLGRSTECLPLLPCLLLSMTLGLYAPLESYLSQVGELWFSIVDLLPVTAAVMALCFFGSLGIGWLLRGKARRVYAGLLVGSSCALYLQGLVLNVNYGVLNGTPIQWNNFGAYPIWNSIVWVLVLLVPIVFSLWKKARTQGVFRFVSVLLMLTQVFSLGAMLLTTDLSDKGQTYYLSTKNEFHFSKNKNVVVFAIDSFTPDLLAEMRENYPTAFDEWTGFVNFPNSTGTFPATELSTTNLLTGTPYLPTETISDYKIAAYQNAGFYPALKENNYKTDIYTWEATAPVCEDLFDNYVTANIHVNDGFKLFKKMYRMMGFRYMPHAVKRFFWMNSADFDELRGADYEDMFVRDDIAFRERYDAQGITVDMDSNCFRFFLLWGPHGPFVRNTPTSFLPYGNDVVTQHLQTLTTIDTVNEVLKGMKAADIYDDATIFILSDHGDPLMDCTPILLVKKPGATGPITDNISFVNHNDFQATVYALAGMDATTDLGENVFDVGDKKRTFVFHFARDQDKIAYLYDMTMLEAGTIHFEQQPLWYDQAGAHEVIPKKVDVGIEYHTATVEQTYAMCDFMDQLHIYARDDHAVWLGKPGITLRVRLKDSTSQKLSIALALKEVMNGEQRVVVARGEKVYETLHVTSDMSTLTIDVPSELSKNGEIVLELRFPDAMSEYAKNEFANPHDMYYRQAIAIESIAFLSK